MENARAMDVAGRVEAIAGDMFEPLDGRTFDLIVSNPPYIPDGMRESLPVEVREHEPAEALFAGPEGMDVIKKIAAGAPEFLEPSGWLALEVDESHAGQVAGALEEAGWADVEVFCDLAGRQRIVRARRG
jgi:release factor glutamine methyltransferase